MQFNYKTTQRNLTISFLLHYCLLKDTITSYMDCCSNILVPSSSLHRTAQLCFKNISQILSLLCLKPCDCFFYFLSHWELNKIFYHGLQGITLAILMIKFIINLSLVTPSITLDTWHMFLIHEKCVPTSGPFFLFFPLPSTVFPGTQKTQSLTSC